MHEATRFFPFFLLFFLFSTTVRVSRDEMPCETFPEG